MLAVLAVSYVWIQPCVVWRYGFRCGLTPLGLWRETDFVQQRSPSPREASAWQRLELSHTLLMLSDRQRRAALKKNIARARDMARRLIANGVEELTLTHYADEGSFRAKRLPEESDDFEQRQRTNTEV